MYNSNEEALAAVEAIGGLVGPFAKISPAKKMKATYVSSVHFCFNFVRAHRIVIPLLCNGWAFHPSCFLVF